MSLQKTEASAGTAHIFLKRVNFNLCFTCLKRQLLFHCFHFLTFLVCTSSCFALSLFQCGACSEFFGVLRRSPPTVTVMFLAFIRISNRVESSRVEQQQHQQQQQPELQLGALPGSWPCLSCWPCRFQGTHGVPRAFLSRP